MCDIVFLCGALAALTLVEPDAGSAARGQRGRLRAVHGHRQHVRSNRRGAHNVKGGSAGNSPKRSGAKKPRSRQGLHLQPPPRYSDLWCSARRSARQNRARSPAHSQLRRKHLTHPPRPKRQPPQTTPLTKLPVAWKNPRAGHSRPKNQPQNHLRQNHRYRKNPKPNLSRNLRSSPILPAHRNYSGLKNSTVQQAAALTRIIGISTSAARAGATKARVLYLSPRKRRTRRQRRSGHHGPRQRLHGLRRHTPGIHLCPPADAAQVSIPVRLGGGAHPGANR